MEVLTPEDGFFARHENDFDVGRLQTHPELLDWFYEDFERVPDLKKKLEQHLKVEKRNYMAASEILLPNGLTDKVAEEMFTMADSEPCGLRGCNVFIEFVSSDGSTRKLKNLKYDPSTPTTFELHLTLKQDTAGWNAFLPQFLKKIARGGTIMISSEYRLWKKKLYRPMNM